LLQRGVGLQRVSRANRGGGRRYNLKRGDGKNEERLKDFPR
jgi:hypothetical protein